MNEKIEVYEEKMTKTMNNLNGELATIRAGRANPHVLDKTDRRLLWFTDTDPAGGKCLCSGGSDDPDSAMGKKYAERDRESNPDF